MKDTSEPTGSPAPVIQHSSLASSPSAGHNGLSSRAAAEAMAMSVLAGMGQQQQRAESGPSHVIMAAQSQSAARWWAMPPWPRLGLHSNTEEQERNRQGSRETTLFESPNSQPLFFFPLPAFLLPLCASSGAILLGPGAQQQPSGNGLRLLRELPVHFAIDYRGWTPTSHSPIPPSPHSSLLTLSQNDSSLDCRTASLWVYCRNKLPMWTSTTHLHGFKTHLQMLQKHSWSVKDTKHGTWGFSLLQQGIVPCTNQLFTHTLTHTQHTSTYINGSKDAVVV